MKADEPTMTPRPSQPRRRRWKLLAAFSAIVFLIVAAIPQIANTSVVREWLIRRANRAIAPGGGLGIREMKLSWLRPTQLKGFAIRNDRGEAVVAATTATWDRNLWQILFDRPRYGTLILDQPRFDVVRREDGTVDLYEALKPILSKNPKVDLHIKGRGGQLQFRDAHQAAPVSAERVDLTLDIPASPRPLTWQLRLENPTPNGPASVQVDGEYDRWTRQPGGTYNLAVRVKGNAWGWSLGDANLALSGLFSGEMSARTSDGLWEVTGRTTLDALTASGNRLAGDHPHFGQVTALWNAGETGTGWAIDRLDLHSSLVNIQGRANPSADSRLEGSLDLAALAREMPHVVRLREGITLERGLARFTLGSKANGSAQSWDLEAVIADLQARNHDRAFAFNEPATISASLKSQGQQVAIERFRAHTKSFDMQGSGDLDQGVQVSGTADLQGLQDQFRELLTLDLPSLTGKGSFSGKYRRTGSSFQANLVADLLGFGISADSGLDLRGEQAKLKLALEGTSSPMGLPTAWSKAEVGLSSGEITGEIVGDHQGGAINLNGTLQYPLPSTKPSRQSLAKLDARWDKDKLLIQRLEVGLSPLDQPQGERRLALLARGSVDIAAGELVLTPLEPSVAAQGIALAPDGIRVTGLGRPGALRGTLSLAGDVSGIRALFPDSRDGLLANIAGDWSAKASVDSSPNDTRFASRIELNNLTNKGAETATPRVESPITVSLNAVHTRDSDQLEIPEFGIASRYAALQGSGRLTELRGKRVVTLQGSLLPDWNALTAMASQRIEPRARVVGKESTWKLQAALNDPTQGDLLQSLEGEAGINLEELDVYGLHARSTHLVLRAAHGTMTIDPIETALNGGRLHLEPTLEFDSINGPIMRLGPESSLTDAEINDEVSRRFLSYVAPVLDRATRAHGKVSVKLDEAIIPLSPRGKQGTSVDGSVVFQEVEFTPGPFVDAFLDLIGRADHPTVKLNDPVALTIADDRVYQRGFAFPLGKLTQIELEGWVDFDRNLEMKASVPLTSAMVFNRPLLGNIVEGTRIQVPIRGTLQKPIIDRDAMNMALRDLGKTLLERSAVQGAAALLMKLTEKRDPNAPRPPTAAERRALRKKRQEERRRAREVQP